MEDNYEPDWRTTGKRVLWWRTIRKPTRGKQKTEDQTTTIMTIVQWNMPRKKNHGASREQAPVTIVIRVLPVHPCSRAASETASNSRSRRSQVEGGNNNVGSIGRLSLPRRSRSYCAVVTTKSYQGLADKRKARIIFPIRVATGADTCHPRRSLRREQ